MTCRFKIFVPSTMRPQQPHGPTVADIVARFLKSQSARADLGTLKANTIERQSESLLDFAGVHGDRLVSEMKNADLVDWINAHEQWRSPHTKVTNMAHVVACFRWACDEGHTAGCPFRRRAKLWPRLEPRTAITEAEYRKMMALARGRKAMKVLGKRYRSARCYRKTLLAFRFAMYFLWETGARVGEMKALRWRDVDLETGVAILLEHKTRQATGQRRLIVLTPPLARMLRWFHHRARPDPQGFVFVNGRAKQWKSSFAKVFRRYAGLAGVRKEVSAYSLRHGFVVRALENRVGQRQIADLIGHTSTRYVEYYSRSIRQNVLYLQGILADMNAK